MSGSRRGQYDGMPSTGGMRERLDKIYGAVSVGAVTATHVISGRVYVDVDDLDSSQHYTRCPLMCWGGDANRLVYFPVSETPKRDEGLKDLPPAGGSEQAIPDNEVVILHRPQGRPYVIGMPQHPEFAITETTEADPGEADHGGGIGKNDIAFQNGGGKVLLDSNGAVTVVAGEAKRVRAQLPEDDGRLRISRGGEAAEKVILANAFLDDWVNQDLKNHLRAQEDRITALETALQTVIGVLSAGLPVAGTPPVATPAPGSLPTVTVDPQTVPETDDSHKSGTIELASKALSEE